MVEAPSKCAERLVMGWPALSGGRPWALSSIAAGGLGGGLAVLLLCLRERNQRIIVVEDCFLEM